MSTGRHCPFGKASFTWIEYCLKGPASMRLRFQQIFFQSDRNQPHLPSIFLDLNRDSAEYGIAMQKPLTLNDAELEETFSRSSGPGGQNVNKVSTRVTLRHLPTNINVTVQD